MRKLLNCLYVLTEDAYLTLEGENVVILQGETSLGRFPLHVLETILCFSYKGASPALLGACCARNIPVCFFTPYGRFLCRVTGEVRGNVLLRREQFRRAENTSSACELARCFLIGKIWNSRQVLLRACRDHPQRLDTAAFQAASDRLGQVILQLDGAVGMETLRGLEGTAAKQYFDLFGQMVLQNREDFAFYGRSRRPPLDRINAVLSFVYTLLAHDCASALEGVGLDPYVGYLHTDRPGRASLALDLMEELRPVMADRLALTLVNTKVLSPKQFEVRENGAVFLDESGRKTVLTAWQERKRDLVQHPFLKERMAWGLIPHVQALLLARCLRGDMEQYPPYFWK